MEKGTRYRLNTGQIIEDEVIIIECLGVIRYPCSSRIMSRWGREYLNAYTQALQGKCLLKIHCLNSYRHIVYWDWSDEREIFLSEWKSKHKLWHDSCIEI